MYLTVYVSSAVELFSDEDLDELLSRSRKYNSASNITGILLYKDGNFMQFLEGPKKEVEALMAKIELDPRHRGLIVLLKEEHENREFDQWAMGFKKIDSNTELAAEGYSDFLNLPLNSEQFVGNPSKSLKLLLNFKKRCANRARTYLHRAAAAQEMEDGHANGEPVLDLV